MARRLTSGPSFADQLLHEAAVDIRQNPEAVDPAFMARQLVQCTLPHSDPGDVSVWTRTNGALTLAIRPYVDLKTRKPLYPYGSIPRLLLFWIVTEATQKKSRHIKLGNSLDGFVRAIGLNPRTGGGKRGDAKRLHDQMERLFRSIISFEDQREDHKHYLDMQIAPKGVLWWDTKRTMQDNLWDSWIELGETFYEAITAAPVPVDLRALRALKRSPLALDLYSWLTYTAFIASRTHKTRLVPWEGLHAQMGAEYAEIRQFKAKVVATLRKVKLTYPALRAESTAEGLAVYPSATAIPSKATAHLSTSFPKQDVAEPGGEAQPIFDKAVMPRRRTRILPEALGAARRVMAECGLSDVNLESVIAAALIARTNASNGVDLEKAIEIAISNRREFVSLGDLLKYTVGPEKFFSQGWCWDWKLWPLDRAELRRRQNAKLGS